MAVRSLNKMRLGAASHSSNVLFCSDWHIFDSTNRKNARLCNCGLLAATEGRRIPCAAGGPGRVSSARVHHSPNSGQPFRRYLQRDTSVPGRLSHQFFFCAMPLLFRGALGEPTRRPKSGSKPGNFLVSNGISGGICLVRGRFRRARLAVFGPFLLFDAWIISISHFQPLSDNCFELLTILESKK